MNQALLKDIDKDILRKIEIEYFQDNYSIFFGDSNKSDIKPLLRH